LVTALLVGLFVTALSIDSAHVWVWQKRREIVADADRACSRTAATVGGREGLVDVVVHHVEPHVAGAGPAEQRVQVRAVVVEQSPGVVDEFGGRLDVALAFAFRDDLRDFVRNSPKISRLPLNEKAVVRVPAFRFERERKRNG
jgi:hypothetical protein